MLTSYIQSRRARPGWLLATWMKGIDGPDGLYHWCRRRSGMVHGPHGFADSRRHTPCTTKLVYVIIQAFRYELNLTDSSATVGSWNSGAAASSLSAQIGAPLLIPAKYRTGWPVSIADSGRAARYGSLE